MRLEPVTRPHRAPRSRTSRRTGGGSTTSTSTRCPTATRERTSRSRCARSSRRWSSRARPASEAVAKELSRAALMGARGNSGVIFSQIVRGFVDVLGRTEDVDADALRAAFRGASDAAYRAVKRPVEGTMLTVIREMAEEAERKESRSLPPAELLAVALARGEDALSRTPEMLDVLRDAGVVDAGGAGLVEIMRGLALAMAGEPLPEAPRRRRGARPSTRSTRSSRSTATAPSSSSRAKVSTSSARERARADRRLAARRRRRVRAQGARPHGRAGRRAQRRHGDRRRRRRRDREHARPDDAARGAAVAGVGSALPRWPRSRPASSRSARARATAGSSRAWARPA